MDEINKSRLQEVLEQGLRISPTRGEDGSAMKVDDLQLKDGDYTSSALTLHSWSEGGALGSGHTTRCRKVVILEAKIHVIRMQSGESVIRTKG
jgi:hypothetical protein